MKTLVALSLISLCILPAQEAMRSTNGLEQHEWLQQLVGRWKVTSEAVGPDGDAARWESSESVRSIGGLWIVAEGTADDDGETFTSLLTVGYDPDQEAFVASWIDTNQTRMWLFVGHLDEDRRVLTLEAEGPSYETPGETARYREQLELITADHKRTTSSVLGQDGAWTPFMTVDARRE